MTDGRRSPGSSRDRGTSRQAAVRVVGAMLAGAALLAALGACTTTAVPSGGPTPLPSSPTLVDPSPGLSASAAPAEPRGDNDFVEGANDSDAAESPTFTEAELSDQVERAARGFATAALARGYPDEHDHAYARRTGQLTTSRGSARQQRLDDEHGGTRAAADLYARRLRTRAEVDAVAPTLLATDRATAEVEYRLVTQRFQDGTWRTVSTSRRQVQTLGLVDRPGTGWLVDAVR